jgi:light-regulated signal transduction histidine kinase (bacteriophytochrome)
VAATDAAPDLPAIVADTGAASVPIFPRRPNDRSIGRALLRSPPADSLKLLRDRQIGSAMTIPLSFAGRPTGHIWCESRAPRHPNFELHAAAELFAQMLALRLEIDRLGG